MVRVGDVGGGKNLLDERLDGAVLAAFKLIAHDGHFWPAIRLAQK
jgi:hypothetical protein